MTPPRIYRTDGIVLKGYDYGEADRILTLYTPSRGKLRVIAKGVRRTKSRKAGHLDLFIRSNVLVAKGRLWDVVTQAETLETFRAVREDLWKSSCCHYVAELVDSFCEIEVENQPLYELTAETFRQLADTTQLAMVVRNFELQLLTLTGYQPQLFRCLQCDERIEPIVNVFSPRLGGVLCPNCTTADGAAPRISVKGLKALRNIQTNGGAMLAVAILESDIEIEIEKRLQEYIMARLESRPRSIKFLDRLRAEGYKA